MKINIQLISSVKKFSLFLLLVSIASLLFAYVNEYFFNIIPCSLCLYQRYIFGILIISCMFGFFINNNNFIRLYIFILLAGFGLSSYHLGVEQHWWKGPKTCTSSKTTKNLSIQERIQQFETDMQSTNLVRCDIVNWKILGLSATLWLTFFYLGLIILALKGDYFEKRD